LTQRQVRAMKSALHDGFSGRVEIAEVKDPHIETRVAYEITPNGFDNPITVNSRGLDLPASVPDLMVAGIRLDYQAVMATTK
jgi:hypothetical protein